MFQKEAPWQKMSRLLVMTKASGSSRKRTLVGGVGYNSLHFFHHLDQLTIHLSPQIHSINPLSGGDFLSNQICWRATHYTMKTKQLLRFVSFFLFVWILFALLPMIAVSIVWLASAGSFNWLEVVHHMQIVNFLFTIASFFGAAYFVDEYCKIDW